MVEKEQRGNMKKEIRTVVYDDELCIEAYYFNGIVQPFPNHFHEYYVLGLIEGGERILSCKNKEYQLKKGNIILFNPEDNHACAQNDEGTFAYRCINISRKKMLELTKEITGRQELPIFSQNVIYHTEIIKYFYELHEKIMNTVSDFGKEESLLLLISVLIQNYGQLFETALPECREQIEKTCKFMKEHFYERIDLGQLCQYSELSKSTLLRAFIKEKGISPYRYLETVRISEAKRLLKKGIQPIDAAYQTGFFDQSHFTHYFHKLIGISPSAYYEIFSGRKKGKAK